jgi:ketosteroid isomerase-like protein
LDNSVAGVQPKLALIRDLFTPTAGKAAQQAQAAAPTPASIPAPTAAPASVPVVASTQPKVPTMVTASPTGTNQPNVAPPAVTSALSGRDVEIAVNNWAQAWSERNMKNYLASYTGDFIPANKQSHAAWEAERKLRIMSKMHINVKLSNIVTSVNGSTATIKFRQDYKADGLATNSRKTLELVKSGDRWLISKEIAG